MDIDERQILIHKKQQRSPDYLAMNPLGKIPCLKVYNKCSCMLLIMLCIACSAGG